MTTKPHNINCPNCKTSILWDSQSPWRPFCSQRCKNSDFISWANEEHVLAGNASYDDVLTQQLSQTKELQHRD